MKPGGAWLPLAAFLTALAVAAPPAHAGFPGQNGKIAFEVHNGGGDRDIYVMNPDGSGRTQLTSGTDSDMHPHWSPDGTKILFSRGVPRNLYVMNADGSSLQQVTNRSGVNEGAWSPDGTRIVYYDDVYRVFTADPDGTNEQHLSFSTAPYNFGGIFGPAWSPDGTEIAFTGFDCTFHCIGYAGFTIHPDATGYRNITGGPGSHDWSPDGRYLVFGDEAGFAPDGLGRINRNGPGYIHLAHAGLEAAWSPDGTKIVNDVVFYEELAGELFVMNPDGTGQTNITNTPSVDEFAPDWQPIPVNAYPRPKGDPGARLACASLCPLRIAQPPARSAAGVRVLQPAYPDLRRAHGGNGGLQRQADEVRVRDQAEDAPGRTAQSTG